MAYDAHKNFAYSTVLTAPSPASSGTSLVVQSSDGTKFPAASFNATVWPAGTQPSTTNAEVVRVTNVSTDTFTITREQESSAARSIVAGDQIAAGVTVKNITDIESAFPNGAWSTWVPSWTNLTVGNGTVTANYTQLGKTVHYHLEIVWGTTTSLSGTPRVTLPVATHANYKQFTSIMGTVGYFDATGLAYMGIAWWYDNDELFFDVGNSSGSYTNGTNVSSTVPFTWTTSDRMAITGTYEAA